MGGSYAGGAAMSHEATNWAFRQKGLKPATRIVLLMLADRHNPDFGCFPSKKRLSADCEMSVRSVFNHIKILEQAGLVQVVTGGMCGEGRFASNRYVLGFEPEFDAGKNCPQAKFADGKSCLSPQAKFADDRGQNLPNNPVSEPSKINPVMGDDEKDLLEAPQTKPKAKRACQLPEGWVPNTKNIDDAFKLGMTQEEIDHEADQFRDHAAANGRTQKDWDAAWRTWCRNSRKFSGSRRMASKAGSTGYRQGGGLAAAYARRYGAGEI